MKRDLRPPFPPFEKSGVAMPPLFGVPGLPMKNGLQKREVSAS